LRDDAEECLRVQTRWDQIMRCNEGKLYCSCECHATGRAPQYVTIDEYTNCEIVPIDATGVGVALLDEANKRAEKKVAEYLTSIPDRHPSAPLFCPQCGKPRTWDGPGGELRYYCGHAEELPPDIPLVERSAPRIPDLCPDDSRDEMR
jgi:hypothetical protein